MKAPAMDVPADRAAACVKRDVTETDKDGNAKTKQVAVAADEVFACRVRDGRITVVTTDGKKLTGNAPKEAAK